MRRCRGVKGVCSQVSQDWNSLDTMRKFAPYGLPNGSEPHDNNIGSLGCRPRRHPCELPIVLFPAVSSLHHLCKREALRSSAAALPHEVAPDGRCLGKEIRSRGSCRD